MTKKIKKLVVGNWKMNPQTTEEAKKIARDVKRGVKNMKKTQTVMCPPFVYLPSLSGTVSNTLMLGTQDAFYEEFGAFTGEVSFSQIHQFKTSFVIVGHSERRFRGESNEEINKKVRVVVGAGMTAILCLGESVRDQHGDYLSFIREQIISGLKDISKKSVDHIVVAYEPVWAIGAKSAMTPREIHEMYIFIKKVLKEIFGPISEGIRILYGGSVNTENAGNIMKEGFVNGLLVGRDSINPKNFVEIVKQVEKN